MAFDGVAARFTVSGSFSSCLATLGVLLYSLATRRKHYSIWRVLVLSLVLAGGLRSYVLQFSAAHCLLWNHLPVVFCL